MKRQSPSSKLATGTPIPDFELPGTDGQTYSRTSLIEQYPAGLAVVFTCNHCPYAQGWEERLKNIAETYSKQGFGLFAICSNDAETYPDDSFESMKKKNFNFPYLHDETQEVAKAFDAACTPEVFAFDQQGKLAYQGAVDDNYQDPGSVTENWLINAIEAILRGSLPEKQTTWALGCSIKWK